MIEVELPDGTIAEFPDGTPQDAIKGALQKRFQKPQQAAMAEQPGVMEDVAKSGGIGIAKGVIAAPGAFGAVSALNERLASQGAEYLGAPEWAQNVAGKAGRYLLGPLGSMPTTQQIQGTIEQQTGKFYEPQTTAGEYAETIGEFAPTALMGPGSVARKTAMAVVPAVASETAGQMTGDNPYAKAGTAIVASALTAGKSGAATKAMREAAPDAATVKAQTDAAYTRLREAGIQFKDNPYKGMVMRIRNKLHQHGWRPRDGDPISGDIKELESRIGKPNDWSEVENLRQYVGNLPTNASKTDITRARIIKDEIDAFIAEAGNIESTKGVAPEVVSTMAKQARELARKNIMARELAAMKDKSQWYLGGEESGLRNQVASFGRKNQGKLTDAEKEALKKITNREGPMNLLHTTGSRIGQIGMTAAGIGSGIGVVPTALGLGGHLVARKLSEKYTQKAINDAIATVLAGRPAQKRALLAEQGAKKEIMARRLIGAGAGYQSSTNN